MIRLDIQEYCDSCCDFEPDVAKPVKTSFMAGPDDIMVVQSDTIVRCTHAKRCECIRRYLKQQMEEPKDIANEKND